MADQSWEVVAALVDPVRRSLYEYVRRESHPVTREEAAQAVEISRGLAAFHLDKLVEVGMLSARYEAPSEQPRGRGRTPKVYVATGDGLTLTLPPRRYELMATILADAVATGTTDAAAAAREQAAALGHAIGAAGVRTGRAVDRVEQALADLGFEPRREAGDIVMNNCPFHPLAQRHTSLICGINVDFVAGLLAGLGGETLHAELMPRPGACCVRVRPQ